MPPNTAPCPRIRPGVDSMRPRPGRPTALNGRRHQPPRERIGRTPAGRGAGREGFGRRWISGVEAASAGGRLDPPPRSVSPKPEKGPAAARRFPLAHPVPGPNSSRRRDPRLAGHESTGRTRGMGFARSGQSEASNLSVGPECRDSPSASRSTEAGSRGHRGLHSQAPRSCVRRAAGPGWCPRSRGCRQARPGCRRWRHRRPAPRSPRRRRSPDTARRC